MQVSSFCMEYVVVQSGASTFGMASTGAIGSRIQYDLGKGLISMMDCRNLGSPL